MQESSIPVSGSFYQPPPTPAPSLARRLFPVLLPLLTIVIVGGSLFALQWVGQYALVLGYPAPHVHINVPSTGSLVRLQSYQFSSIATAGRGLTYEWDFGDQSSKVHGPSVSHAYEQAGSFTITLTAIDPTGQSATQTSAVTVLPSVPQASFTYYAYSFVEVSFDATGSTADPSTLISRYSWDFGDGSTSTTYYGFVYHFYSASGTYNVTLVVTDEAGQSSTPYSQSVTVSR